MRLLVTLVAIVAIVLIVRFLLKQRRASRPKIVAGGDVVRCTRCGLHVPVASAVQDGQDWYCSPEHRRLGRGDHHA
jgi:uncharacterized protein